MGRDMKNLIGFIYGEGSTGKSIIYELESYEDERRPRIRHLIRVLREKEKLFDDEKDLEGRGNIYARLGNHLTSIGKYRFATRALEKALSLEKEGEPIKEGIREIALDNLVNAYMETGRYEEALSQNDSLFPSKSGFFYHDMRSKIFQRVGRVDEAYQEFRKIVDEDSSFIGSYEEMLKIHIEKDDPVGFELVLDEMLEKNKGSKILLDVLKRLIPKIGIKQLEEFLGEQE